MKEIQYNLKISQPLSSRLTMTSTELAKPSPALTTGSGEDQAPILSHKLDSLEVIEPSGQDEPEYPTGVKFAAVMVAVGLSLVLVGLDTTILATAIPSITNHFNTIADIGWYASAYRLTACSLQFMFGKFYSLFSVKTVFLVALAIFEAGSVIAASAPSSKALVVGRAISGVGGAGIIQGIFTMIGQTVPLRRRSVYGGLGAGIETVAGISAPLLGGVLTDNLSWRWCFWINLPLGAVTLVVVGFLFENPQVNPNLSLPLKAKLDRLDLLGTAIFVPSITALLLALQWGGSKYGWTNSRIVVLLALFAVLIGAFGWLQFRKGERATLPPRIIMQRSILCGAWFSCCTNASLSVVEYYVSRSPHLPFPVNANLLSLIKMPIYFQAVKEVSASKSGVLTIPLVVGLAISVVLSGTATSIVGYYTPFMFFTSILTPVAAGLLTTIQVNEKLTSLVCYQALLGFSAGIGLQAPQIAAQTILSPQDAPMGIAVVQFMQGLGPAIFISAAQTLFTTRLAADLAEYAGSLNATTLETMGLSDLKRHIGAKNLEGALLGYDKAVTQTFYLPVALTCLSLLGTVGMEWRSVKKKQQ